MSEKGKPLKRSETQIDLRLTYLNTAFLAWNKIEYC